MPKLLDDIRGSKGENTPSLSELLRAPEPTENLSLVRTAVVSLPAETLRTATRLRMSLTQDERSIAFTSLVESDLAPALAQSIAVAFSNFEPGQVLLVSAGPTADTTTGPGLAELLNGDCGIQAALGEPQQGGPWLLASGKMPVDRSQLFFSPACAVLLTALRQRFKYVLVDAGPLQSPGSLVMVGHCDTVAVALAAGPHHKSEVKQLQSELARVKTRTLGVVLTGTRR